MTKKHKKLKPSVTIPNFIINIAKGLQVFSPHMATIFAAKLFSTPIRHKAPKREHHMYENSVKKLVEIPGIQKKIMVYEYGKSDKKILLVHGWSGRGTQLVKIADAFLELGFQIISFDAPAHGRSEGKMALMPDFISSILHLEKIYGKFDGIVGHSLGGMATLQAIKNGLNVPNAVVIGSGDVVQDILDNFVSQLQLKPEISIRLKNRFEQMAGITMDSLSGYQSAKAIQIPVLVIHDTQDGDVPVESSIHIHQHLSNGSLIVTEGLGHRKILGDPLVIEKTVEFITHSQHEKNHLDRDYSMLN